MITEELKKLISKKIKNIEYDDDYAYIKITMEDNSELEIIGGSDGEFDVYYDDNKKVLLYGEDLIRYELMKKL